MFVRKHKKLAVAVFILFVFLSQGNSVSAQEKPTRFTIPKLENGKQPTDLNAEINTALGRDENQKEKFKECPSTNHTAKDESSDTKDVKLTFKPIPRYTSEARENGIEGEVVLKVTFLSTGVIGKVRVVNALEFGLTQQTFEAVKKIEFTPAEKNGKAVSVKRCLRYKFEIY